jgi:hypothetical protein
LDPTSRTAILSAAAGPTEPVIYRRLAGKLGHSLESLSDETGVACWKMQRTLAGRRPAERELLDKIGAVLGATSIDVRFAMLRHLEAAS